MSGDRGTQPSEVTKPREAATTCPGCATPRTTADRFCELCGHDFDAADVPTWELVIETDREHHARFAVAGFVFPEGVAAQRVPLDAGDLRIGRHDGHPEGPTINGAADDPALSRRHAVLRRLPDGSFTIEDLGSTNGTELNGRQIAPHDPVRLAPGDRLLLGAWTAITIRSREA